MKTERTKLSVLSCVEFIAYGISMISLQIIILYFYKDNFLKTMILKMGENKNKIRTMALKEHPRLNKIFLVFIKKV